MVESFEYENLGEEEMLVNDFLLMAFSDTKSRLGLDLVGVSMDMKTLFVYSGIGSTPNYKLALRKDHKKKINNVVPADYDSSGNVSYLLVSRKDAGYENTVFFSHAGEVVPLDKTVAPPLLFCYQNPRPALLMQTQKETYALKFSKNRELVKSFFDIDVPTMHHMHTSAFIDVTGNLLADLVLETQTKDGRYLEVLENKNGVFQKASRCRLPENIGPLAFSDFNGSGLIDVAFVSKEGGKDYLNVLFNTGKSVERFTGDSARRISLESIKPGYEAVLRNNDFDMPAGIFVSDVFCNSVPQIVLMMKSRNSNSVFHLLMENTGKGSFKPNKKIFAALPRRNIVSMCLVDVINGGAESPVVNYYENGKYHLSLYRNSFPIARKYHLKVLTYDCNTSKESFGSVLPGVSYRYRHMETPEKSISFQMPQSSFPHLQHPFVFLGLGTMPHLVEFEGVGIPFYNRVGRVFTIYQKIIPNSQLALRPQNDTLRLYLNLVVGQRIKTVFFVLVAGLFVNLVLLLILYIRGRKRERSGQKSVLFDFEDL